MPILVVSSEDDLTTDKVVLQLQALGAEYFRWNTDQLGGSSHFSWKFLDKPQGSIAVPKGILDIQKIGSVWYRRPGLPSSQTEYGDFVRTETWTILQSFLNTFHASARWMNHPLANARAEHKLLQLQVAKDLGLAIPQTVVTNDPKIAWEFYSARRRACICKAHTVGELHSGSQRLGLYTWALPGDSSQTDFDSVSLCPTMLQERVVKVSDVRITVVGNDVFAVRIDTQSSSRHSLDWRRPGIEQLAHTPFDLPKETRSAILNLMLRFELVFGALDFVETADGGLVFLEVNPNGQWGWVEDLVGAPISKAIAQWLVANDAAQRK